MCKKLMNLVFFVLVLSIAGNVSANLVAHWKFDDGSGTTAQDSSGNGYDGILFGEPKWISGRIGGALEFDGTNDYVELPIGSLISSLTSSTFATWVDFSNEGGGWQRILDFGTGTTVNMFLTPRMGTGGSMRFAITIGGSGDEDQTTAQATLPSGWHQVVLTINPDENLHSLYLDGELAAQNITARHTPSTLGETNQNWLGRSQYAADGFFDGRLDDFRIYDRVLTQRQIRDLFNGIPPEFTKALNPTPGDGAYHLDTWVNLSWVPGDSAASHDVYFSDNFEDVQAGAEGAFQGNQTSVFYLAGFPGFVFPDGFTPGTTYYWRVDELEADGTTKYQGNVWSFTVPPRTAYKPEPADGAELVATDVKLKWEGGFGVKLHTVYFGDNFDDVNNATVGLPHGATTYTPGPLKLGKTYYWRVDEFDAFNTHKGNVWSFTTEGAVGSPIPSNGAVDVKQTQILRWSPGVYAALHQVYFGADKEAVRNADTGSPEYKSTRDLGAESYDPGMLQWDTTYYWRVDEVNNTNPDSPWKGNIWSFTTANFLIVDDFESYNDLDPADPESNRIFNAWIDGYGDPTNGSLVGYEIPPFAEQTIVHGGSQSMPLHYDNSVGYSEATLTLTYPRDWTENGVSTLRVWFRGNSDNAAETLYVALNGNAIVT
ncbi:MAG: LamG-like jellyroll fold domain-containing protein, partial [Phycisphaerae bacterium]